jgi:uncharacterized membrane protein YhaH (DUF805 family)
MSNPSPGLIENAKTILTQNYCNFNDRARRSEYWLFVLFNIIVEIILSAIGAILVYVLKNQIISFSLLSLYSLIIFIPGLALTIRRLHDTGKSGWYILVALIPIVGGIIVLYFLVQDSQQEQNEYGISPKYGGIITSPMMA